MPSISRLLYASLAGWSIGSAAPHHPHKHHHETPKVITEPQWRDIVKYTKYAAAAYQFPCPNPPNGAKVHTYIDIQNTTTQAYVFRNDQDKEFILAFPGTRGPEDQSIDEDDALTAIDIPGMNAVQCEGCEVHTGYMMAWQSIAAHVMVQLKEVHQAHEHYKTTIVGHSLGGALASLSTMSLRQLNFPITQTFSFGQPRTGNKAFADRQDELNHVVNGSRGHFHRVVHAADGVPHWPSRKYGYHHHSTEYWERNVKHIKATPHVQSRARTYRCYGQEPPNCANMEHPKGITNNAHVHYSNILMGDPAICHGGT